MLPVIEAFISNMKGASRLSPGELLKVAEAYGRAIVGEVNGYPDSGEGIMTKPLLLERKLKCSECPLKVAGTCSTERQVEHATLKNEDGTAKMANGCGCNLFAKQADFNFKCPAGKW